MMRKIFALIKTHENHISALAMVGGFVVDNLLFGRVDVSQTQLVFASYALVCFFSITLLHYLEERGRSASRLRSVLPIVTQFALGGFWSGFLIFYFRAADLASSWPFILFLVLVFLGNEYFRGYHARLVFTSVLFFFALYSYAIFAVPIYTHTIGPSIFLLSGAVSIALFALFTVALRLVGRERFLAYVWQIRLGALGVLIFLNVCYFTGTLPPLPLSAVAGGIYHQVTRVPGAYMALAEPEPWQVHYLGFSPTLHLVSGEAVYAYSSIFAPTDLTTTIVHTWEWYDGGTKSWVRKAQITYPIAGGRENGYRGYSTITPMEAGSWRINVETLDGRLIARFPFTIENVPATPSLDLITLP